MSGTATTPSGRTGWIAGILRIARIVAAVMAVGCIVVFALAMCVVLYFEGSILSGPPQVAVPPPYAASAPAINLRNVDARLQPPSNIRVVPRDDAIDGPLDATATLGTFAADTVNGLASYPDDVDILGGADADLFDRAASSDGRHAVLVPTGTFRRQVAALLPTLTAQTRRTFHLELVARDRYGLYSIPADAAFSLSFAPPTQPPPQAPPAAAPAPTDLQRLAREIALIAGTEEEPQYLDIYPRALDEPARCGSSAADTVFVTDYRQAFEHARARLDSTNLRAFLDGVCDAWRGAVRAQAQAAAAAEAARGAAIARNQAAGFEKQAEDAAARIARDLSLTVVGSAVGAFLLVSLILAFLAIESHSRATRDAIARMTKQRGAQDRPPSAS